MTGTDHAWDGLRKAVYGPSPAAERTIKTAAAIALRGGMKSRTEFSLDAKPFCSSPVRVGTRKKADAFSPSLEASLWAPCRHCPECLKFRRLHWLERTLRETANTVGRTWSVGLTLDPVMLAGVLSEAHALRDERNFYRRVDQVAYRRFCQPFLKRLRASGFVFRYVFVFELGGETGRPHYHGLLHEGGSKPLTYRQIVGQWPALIKHAKLVPPEDRRAQRYICKYLGKSLDCRPRASQDYGTQTTLTPPREKKGGIGGTCSPI